MKAPIAGWGNHPRIEASLASPRYVDELGELLSRSTSCIARGNGRSYGDASLNSELTIATSHLDRILALDLEKGLIRCEAGLLLADLLDLLVPRGWFVPVVPGTSLVSIGGMAAADVHGKNHHKDGGFGRFVTDMEVLTGDGQVHHCSAENNPELFAATLGGMGLTGIILTVTFRLMRLPSRWIRQTTVAARDLAEIMDCFESRVATSYTVAWIDCLAGGRARGRSLFFGGEHVEFESLPGAYQQTKSNWRPRQRPVPIHAPSMLLNRWSVGLFNRLYHWRGRRRPQSELVGIAPYFFPLDSLANWNRLYGRRGFVQHQCVLPMESSARGLQAILKQTSSSGQGSMLAVLKLLGEQAGPLSFPMRGYTLAMDFPASRASLALLRELDAIVRDHQGRIYLAKDACASADDIRRGYPALDQLMAVREQYQCRGFRSLLSDRLALS